MKPVEEWEYYPNGTLVMSRLHGGGATIVTSGTIVLRLDYTQTPAQDMAVRTGQTNPSSLQLGLTANQAREMIETLEKKLRALSSGIATPH